MSPRGVLKDKVCMLRELQVQPKCAGCVWGPQEDGQSSKEGEDGRRGSRGEGSSSSQTGLWIRRQLLSDPSKTPALCVQGPEGRKGMNQR